MSRDRSSTGSDFLPIPPFRPPAAIRNRHAQTVVGRLARAWTRCTYHRVTLSTPDGDVLHLDWATVRPSRIPRPDRLRPRRPEVGRPRPIVLVLHGLEGSSRSGYVRQTCRRLLGEGLRPVALNFRSCSGEPNLLARSYHSGETGDLRHVVETLRDAHPGAPLAIVGYSLGGNVLLRYLGESGSPPPVVAAAAVSVPFDLSSCATALEHGVGRLYSRWFLRSLRAKTREKARRFPGEVDLERALRARTLREFDDAVTAPVHGFGGAEDYYARCSSADVLEEIRVPTLLLQARDDPFVPPAALAPAERASNQMLEKVFTARGGHLGFLAARSGPGFAPWAEAAVAAWLRARLWHLAPGAAYIPACPEPGA